MKSKLYTEVLKVQLEKSLELLSKSLESDFKLHEAEFMKDIEGKQTKVYSVVLTLNEKKLWHRVYKVVGSSNDVKANAYSELFDTIIGCFLVQASRTDDKTLMELSTNKE